MKSNKMTIGEITLALVFAVIIIVVTAQVVWRYLFNNPLIWTEEASRFLFVWLTFLGAAVTLGQRMHVRVTVFIDALPQKLIHALSILALLLMVAYMVFLLIVGIQWVVLNANVDSPALRLPLNYALYASLPVGCLIGVYLGVRGLGNRAEETPPEKHEMEL